MRLSVCRHFSPERIRDIVPMLAALVVTVILLRPSRAAEPVFEQLLPAMNTTVLLEHRSKLLRGLEGGGIIVCDREDPLVTERWTSGENLSGNRITDMTWTGQHIWIATMGAGMTRVTDLDTAPEFRQYTSNLGSLDVTAVTGTVTAAGEIVFYGMAGDGLGQINSGLSGNIYTVEQDGLISNDISTLQIFRDELFVGTPAGISRFANNIFTDQNEGLTNLVINDLALDSDGNLLAANNAGIYQWDPDEMTWLLLGDIGSRVVDLASYEGQVYALGLDAEGDGVLSEYDGAIWSPIVLPYPLCTAIEAGEDFWIGGPDKQGTTYGKLIYNYLGRRLAGDNFYTSVDTSSQVTNCEGVAFGADGTAWMGDWADNTISSYNAEDNSFFFIYERPHAANDTLNMFPNFGNVLCIAGAPDGTVYAGQYSGGGVIKFDPATRTTDLIDPDNSGLLGRGIANLVVHPDGPLIVMHDWTDVQKVEVLVDPENWAGTSSWMLPPMDQGLGSGSSVWDALVEKRDIIWFAVEGVGLVRWDINGPDAGPNDPLTWFDQDDDVWYDPVAFFSGTSLDPKDALGLALGRDGSLWVGGNGLVQFTYEIGSGSYVITTVKLDFQEKLSVSTNGLVNGTVKDIAVDVNGDVWVATLTGLNRVSPSGDDAHISAWIDLPNYLASSNYGILYSPNVIAPLPGNAYARIAPSHDGKRMLLSADQGATLIIVGQGLTSETGEDPLKNVYFYPNPWTPGEQSDRLMIGGLPVETVQVEIYNVEGQVVFTDNSVAEGIGFWEGDSKWGNPVTSGMYVVKVATGGLTTTRILAVVR